MNSSNYETFFYLNKIESSTLAEVCVGNNWCKVAPWITPNRCTAKEAKAKEKGNPGGGLATGQRYIIENWGPTFDVTGINSGNATYAIIVIIIKKGERENEN